MKSDSCDTGMKLCPVTFGLALGVTAALASIICMAWIMYSGPTAMMVQLDIPMWSFRDVIVCSFWILLKGFIFGAVFAFIYNMIICCCKGMCCKFMCRKDEKSSRRRKK